MLLQTRKRKSTSRKRHHPRLTFPFFSGSFSTRHTPTPAFRLLSRNVSFFERSDSVRYLAGWTYPTIAQKFVFLVFMGRELFLFATLILDSLCTARVRCKVTFRRCTNFGAKKSRGVRGRVVFLRNLRLF